MLTTSNKSKLVYSFKVPSQYNLSAKFVYNFYAADESIQEEPKVPELYKKKTIDKTSVNIQNFSTRVPRYVELNWTTPKYGNPTKENNQPSLEASKDKIATEDNTISSNYTPYTFSSYETLFNASNDIKSDMDGLPLSEMGSSQAKIIDDFISDMLKGYDENADGQDIEILRDRIRKAIASIESFSDRPNDVLGYQFYDQNDQKITVNTFDNLMQSEEKLYSQINDGLLVDIFADATLSTDALNSLNAAYTNFSLQNNLQETLQLQPATVENGLGTLIPDASQTATIVGHLIQRYEFQNNSYKNDKVIFIESADVNSTLDINVKYGATYLYAIRTIARIEMELPSGQNQIDKYVFYVAGKANTTKITCEEDVAPPPPENVGFNWNYKENKLYVTWSMPFNLQNDIKQFQIFRRSNINEPFELLEQHCFDYSSVKRTTGEIIDGNRSNMTTEQKSYVQYSLTPTYKYKDDDFKIDTEMLTSSKYIYAIASVDAHGFISNYSAQFEIIFDFFKNKLIKTLVSNAGAPRQYPNLFLKNDLFKDTISTSGLSSQKLKIYFMPEYFKIKYNSGKIQKMVATNQSGGYYKLQFINTQNQKTDSLMIRIEDDQNLVAIK